jgi:hypothetical protein
MCDDGQYSCKDGVFRMTTIGSCKVARLYLDKQYINYKLHELRCLMNMIHVIQNQLATYTLAMSDVMAYSVTALT